MTARAQKDSSLHQISILGRHISPAAMMNFPTLRYEGQRLPHKPAARTTTTAITGPDCGAEGATPGVEFAFVPGPVEHARARFGLWEYHLASRISSAWALMKIFSDRTSSTTNACRFLASCRR